MMRKGLIVSGKFLPSWPTETDRVTSLYGINPHIGTSQCNKKRGKLEVGKKIHKV